MKERQSAKHSLTETPPPWPLRGLSLPIKGGKQENGPFLGPLNSVVAVDPLAALVPLLGLEAQGRDGPRLQPGQADRLAGLLAEAVGAVLEAPQRLVDLGDQLAL